MAPITILFFVIGYFLLLSAVSFAGRKENGNKAFFLGNKQSPWMLVAFGMLGTSLSGISFVSVPGMTGLTGFTYLQMVLGFSLGYIVVAEVLLPLYYKLQLTSIYEYLGQRFGTRSHKTGSGFFILSRAIGGAARLYITALVLQHFVFDSFQVPFVLTASLLVLLIYLYTFINGIKTIVWTDGLQTLLLLIALFVLLYSAREAAPSINLSDYQFINLEIESKGNFFRLLLSGIFITIAMTGLDQDMMQKNLSCKNLSSAKKNMYSYGFAFIPINFLFLLLGAYLWQIQGVNQLDLVGNSDNLLPSLVAAGHLGEFAILFFIIGITAASFSSADSCLVSITTSISIDLLQLNKRKKATAKKGRKIVHILSCLLFIGLIALFNQIDNSNIIDLLFKISSYTYGPLLGLFTFGLFTKKQIKDHYVPWVALCAPLLCLGIQYLTNFTFGYELLIINGLITFAGLILIKKK